MTGRTVDSITEDGVFHSVLDGYTAVYEGLADGATFNRIWREKAYRGEFPVEFAHIGFLTLGEAERIRSLLSLGPGSRLADLACGAGGPGLWMAQQTGATLVGVDPADSGLVTARSRAASVGLAQRASFRRGTFEKTGLESEDFDAVMSIEAFQYAPSKQAAVRELHRVLRTSGRLSLVCFEVDPDLAGGLPVLGVDPISDYRPLLEAAGFVIEAYEETPGWQERVYGVFQALIDAADALTGEMGEQAAAGALAEAMLTVATKPYPRRILAVATAEGGPT